MPDVTLSEDTLRALLREVVAGALEDAALAEAVRDGRETPLVSRGDVFDALGGNAA